MTQMACPDVQMALESAFTTVLGNVESWSIRGDVLELQTAGGKVGLTFVAVEDPALTGTRWVATGINNGKGGVTSVVGGVEVTAVFAEDGNVAGSGGCNGYSASYTVDGSSIRIGPTAGTMMACADDVNTQETAYHAALVAATTFGFRDGNLELRDDGGALQVSYQATMP
jgi:heat shock protein HslJ